jgi:hypothetical protein
LTKERGTAAPLGKKERTAAFAAPHPLAWIDLLLAENGRVWADVPALHSLIMSMMHPEIVAHASGFTQDYINNALSLLNSKLLPKKIENPRVQWSNDVERCLGCATCKKVSGDTGE